MSKNNPDTGTAKALGLMTFRRGRADPKTLQLSN
jgi:hypothetical protein